LPRFLRAHDFGEARTVLEEATGKWPTEPRFAKPLAMLYGTFGRGREAVRTLERYLDSHADDREAYYYAVQWIYMVRSAGAASHTPAEDLKLAHRLLRRLRQSAAAARSRSSGSGSII
jgi:Tfp pilus assembly protein PilF